MDSLCHPGFTTTKLSYRFPIFETFLTALCGTTCIGGLIPTVEANSNVLCAKSAANTEANRELQGASLPGSHPEISEEGESRGRGRRVDDLPAGHCGELLGQTRGWWTSRAKVQAGHGELLGQMGDMGGEWTSKARDEKARVMSWGNCWWKIL